MHSFGDDAEICEWLAFSMANIRQFDSALASARKAAALNGEFSNMGGLAMLGAIYFRLGDLERARGAWSRAATALEEQIAVRPHTTRYRCGLAVLQARLGKLDKFRTEEARAISEMTTAGHAVPGAEDLIVVHLQLNEMNRAEDLAKRLISYGDCSWANVFANGYAEDWFSMGSLNPRIAAWLRSFDHCIKELGSRY